MIKEINIGQIEHHPDNPRKDIGDVTELAESIKENGILQNLTVVPIKDSEKFYAVIGNRRLEAAKMAGLETVPCVVSNMDYKTQISTMLLENMQRTDLTAYEQAQGFQMMIDLGESVSDICTKTGFSESTVRHRIKLTELDQDILKEKATGEITMSDLIKLEKIKDPAVRNEILADIGTNNFNWKYNNALNNQKNEEQKKKIRQSLNEAATEITHEESREKQCVHTCYNYSSLNVQQIIDDLKKKHETEEFYYCFYTWGGFGIYIDKVFNEEDAAEAEEQEKRKEDLDRRNQGFTKFYSTARETWDEFVKQVSIKQIKEHTDILLREIWEMIEFEADDDVWEIVGIDIEKEAEDLSEKEIIQLIFTTICTEKYPNRYRMPFDYQCKFFEGKKELGNLYKFLGAFGYEPSEEEKQILDGTHELYIKE